MQQYNPYIKNFAFNSCLVVETGNIPRHSDCGKEQTKWVVYKSDFFTSTSMTKVKVIYNGQVQKIKNWMQIGFIIKIVFMTK